MSINNNQNFKSGFITIIGRTNAGKSTLMNSFINANISITSKKKQTTRKNIKGILTNDDAQMIFIDTPGIHKRKNKLDDYMDFSIKKSLEDIDIILYLIDLKEIDIEEEILSINKYSHINKHIVIVFNKIDIFEENELNELKKEINEKFINKLSIKNFSTLYISALRKIDIDKLYDELFELLPLGPIYYNEEQLSDEPVKQIIAEIIRQQCLYKLDKEIPHGINVIIDNMKYNKTYYNIEATIICEKNSHKGIIIGKAGQMLKNIGTAARIYSEKFLDKKVNLKLFVTVKENWRNETSQLINFGFKKQ